ncbi:MAG: calcium/proton exchanger [Planctomycetota bacterium]|jgi:Ca2+:H+ antiporter|nr:calcium/proton exchanger [Planctomycetota bacterium]MDP7129293.1 calcium/proton exchanger [Planctomycetota bacterium]MDP7251342.1 calcium/proton exchanger [Planctomycetota bacterium]
MSAENKKGGFFFKYVLNSLLILVPISFFLEHRDPPNHLAIFICSAIAIIPLAGWMGKATEHLAERLGEGIGGLLNATFGNAAELIIAIMALREGHIMVVKASITGSIIGNILLVFGLACFAGGLKYEKQLFNRTAAAAGTTLLIIGGMALVIPTAFAHMAGQQSEPLQQKLSLLISIALIFTYFCSLYFSLKTHSHLYVGGHGEDQEEEKEQAGEEAHDSAKKWVIVLLVATAFVALMSEILVKSIEHATKQIGLTEVFVGVIVVAIVGNAAEHSSAVLIAMRNRMGLSLQIAAGSSLQIILFVAPILVFCGYAFGQPMDLHFSLLEVLAVIFSVLLIAHVSNDGETNWLEGVMLLSLYVVLAIAFYYLPADAAIH